MDKDSLVYLIYHDPSDLGSVILIRIISKEFSTVRSRFGNFTTNDINCGLRLTVSRYPFGHIWDLRFAGGE